MRIPLLNYAIRNTLLMRTGSEGLLQNSLSLPGVQAKGSLHERALRAFERFGIMCYDVAGLKGMPAGERFLPTCRAARRQGAGHKEGFYSGG